MSTETPAPGFGLTGSTGPVFTKSQGVNNPKMDYSSKLNEYTEDMKKFQTGTDNGTGGRRRRRTVRRRSIRRRYNFISILFTINKNSK
jgi:hypothetical protein